MNQGWRYREQVTASGIGQTVLEYYTQRYRHSTEAEWCNRIAAGQILVDDQPTIATAHLQPGQWLTYDRPAWQEPDVPLSFEVLHEDLDLLVIAKPAGLPVLPGGGFLEHTLLWQLKRQYPNQTPVPIHRLGRGTSGLMLLARSPLARSKLSQQLRDHTSGQGDRTLRKTYRALIGTSDLPDHFTITQPIGKLAHPVLGTVYGATSNGKPACSEGRVLRRNQDSTLVEVTILTGRPHQIRIHLAAIGCPLLGDPLYMKGGIPRQLAHSTGKLPVPGDCGYHLHAYQLVFSHPRSNQCLSITCKPPLELR